MYRMDFSKNKSPIITAGRRGFAALVLCVLLLAVISCGGQNNEVGPVSPANSPLSGSPSLDRVLPASHRIQGFPHIFMGYTGKGGYPAQHFYGRCYMGAFLMVMKYYGFRDTDLLDGITGEAFGFQYYTGANPRIFVMGGPEGYPLGSRHNDVFMKVPPRVGFQASMPSARESTQALEILRTSLAANHPVIVYVDERPLLPALSALSPMRKLQLEELRKSRDESGHWGHHMVAVGYDSSSVTLFDPGDRAESGSYQKVPITDFINAWVGSGPCAYHHYKNFTQVAIVPGGQAPPLREIVSHSLLNNLKLLRGLGPQKVPGRRKGESEEVRYCGLVGLRRLSRDIAARPELIRDIGQEGWMFFFGIQGSMAREASARSLLAFALFSGRGQKNLQKASRYLLSSSKIFREVHSTCLQPGGIGRLTPDYLGRRLKAIAYLEEKAADEMEKALPAPAVPSKRER